MCPSHVNFAQHLSRLKIRIMTKTRFTCYFHLRPYAYVLFCKCTPQKTHKDLFRCADIQLCNFHGVTLILALL